MRVQATVELTVKAASLREAGEVLDELVALVAERNGVEVERVELGTPAPRERVTLPGPPVVRPPERRDAPWMAARQVRAFGLCDTCRHQRLVQTTRGSTFSLCRRSQTDPHYPKYPRMPVVSCPGHEPGISVAPTQGV